MTKAENLRANRLESIKAQDPNATMVEHCDYFFFIYTKDKPTVLAYYKSRKTSDYAYAFQTVEERQNWMDQKFTHLQLQADRVTAEEAKYAKQAEGIKAGTILVSSWGFEQTNIDFYIVTKRTPKSVVIQEIASQIKHTGDMTGTALPDVTKLKGEPITKKINKWAGVNLSSYQSASVWDGTEMNFSSYA